MPVNARLPARRRPPMVTGGTRRGSPAVTTRGFSAAQMRQVGALIMTMLARPDDEEAHARVRTSVAALTARYPVPGITA